MPYSDPLGMPTMEVRVKFPTETLYVKTVVPTNVPHEYAREYAVRALTAELRKWVEAHMEVVGRGY